MYNHTSHSKIIVTARRKQKAKYKMLVQTMFIVKLAHSEWATKQHSVKLSNLLCSNILGQVSHRLPRQRNQNVKWKILYTAEIDNVIMQEYKTYKNILQYSI